MKKIITYKGYFADFVEKLSKDEMNKVRRALDLFKVEDKVPRHFIKFIRDGVYEFRVNYGNNEFRIFFIYDGDTIVVLFNAFKKKTQKTPESEIKKAIKLKEEYYAAKRNQ
ncbi:type II toxin-antitoxin system RelE/ParE family toxin [Parabacteroides merdae]|jgi:putative addiction module killer protein|uniref:Type II toxin-antitoxin system RelE/ParE family toxin n=1 Tax=Parabacteroides merdae TaxID=46503 RepID=A0AA44ANE2_9BACT|nr:type II toxin-antitoxin system RelE/ParE family toxin [Parabacteroides merdae]MTT23292.1 type II toxin-antitoxin system RelE/ParE family toxin [Parabacteroides merdae]MTU53073.1 type II toxin-antitoxin system RelE/ParE family toxin [Parabacteroides merdae]MTU62389.1 type II toxin-antitoxin system RelE/ParE family toxin [Parabacteroides merdae]MTU66387.1 type II toxin-antitoxin system RelE/ParE family toxin [Parabacteroides merdae]MTU69652.1 type II toxin-antitoxin system RelE/ParE family to